MCFELLCAGVSCFWRVLLGSTLVSRLFGRHLVIFLAGLVRFSLRFGVQAHYAIALTEFYCILANLGELELMCIFHE